MVQEQSNLLETCLESGMESGMDFAFTQLSLKTPTEQQETVYALSSYATAEFLEIIGIGAGFASLDMQGLALAQIKKKLEEINQKLDTILETPAKTALEYLERGIESVRGKKNSLAFQEFNKVIEYSMQARNYQKKDLDIVVNLTTYTIFADLMVNTYDTNLDLFVPYQILEPEIKAAIKNKVKKHLDVLLETQANNKPSMFWLPSSKREKKEANQNLVDRVLKKSLQYLCPPGEPIPVRFIPEGEEDSIWLNLNGNPGVLDAYSVYIFKDGSDVVIRNYSISEKHEAIINCEHRVELMVKASSSGITVDDSSKEVKSSPLNYDDFKFITTKGHVTLIKSLGAVDMNKKSSSGDTALISAIMEGNLEVVSVLLHHPGIDVHKPGVLGVTPLHISAWRGHLEVTRLLLNAGADLAAEDMDLETPLHYAARGGNLEVTKLIVEEGGKVDAQNSFRRTPADRAKDWNKKEVELFLNSCI